MSWWEDAEARAHRSKSPADLGQALWQRFVGAGIDAQAAFAPAYDLGVLFALCADLIKLVEGILLATDGDKAALRRQGLALQRWAQSAAAWTELSAPGFNALMDSLQLDPESLAAREEVRPGGTEAEPEAQGKLDGRYRYYHLLFERLDLKLASAGLPEPIHRGLARSLARLYEEALLAIRLIAGIEKESAPRFRQTARLLLELNTSWHFDLGPHHLGHGRLNSQGTTPVGLQTWLLLAWGGAGPFASQP